MSTSPLSGFRPRIERWALHEDLALLDEPNTLWSEGERLLYDIICAFGEVPLSDHQEENI
jgi:hypothetical protein